MAVEDSGQCSSLCVKGGFSQAMPNHLSIRKGLV